MHSLNAQQFLTLRQHLSMHFTEQHVAKVLGAQSMCEWFATREDISISTLAAPEESVTSLLTKLMVLGEAIPKELVSRALGDSTRCLTEAGWLIWTEERVQCSLSVLPCDGLWIVTDHIRSQGKSDSVFFPDSSSVNSFRCFPASRGAHLDLGTGCGLTALAAARNHQRVEINDVNPRALALTKIGFELNGFSPPQVREGDFTANDGQFNSITFNLPVPADGGLSPDEPVHSRSPYNDLLEKIVDWLPGHLTQDGVFVAHTRFPDDIAGFSASVQEVCNKSGWRGLAVHAPEKGTGYFGVLVLEQAHAAAFKCLEIDPHDTVWRTHWEWPAILDLLNGKPLTKALSGSARLEFMPWLRPLARMSMGPDEKWTVESIKLFRVELSGPDAQAFRLLAEGLSLQDATDYISRKFSLSQDEAEGAVNPLALRLLSAGLATVQFK
jgi:hypothetical protein